MSKFSVLPIQYFLALRRSVQIFTFNYQELFKGHNADLIKLIQVDPRCSSRLFIYRERAGVTILQCEGCWNDEMHGESSSPLLLGHMPGSATWRILQSMVF